MKYSDADLLEIRDRIAKPYYLHKEKYYGLLVKRQRTCREDLRKFMQTLRHEGDKDLPEE